jgi:DNA-binding transcriptional regulator YdaS (Cro superfamily)
MAIEHEIDSPFAEAVRIAGSQSAMGRLVGKSQATVHERLKLGKPCWPESVLIVENATGVSRHRLRPDIFGEEDAARAMIPAITAIDEQTR